MGGLKKLSNYWDKHNELREEEIKTKSTYDQLRKRMAREISIENIFRIMFEQYISKLSDNDIERLSKNYLKTK